MGYREEKYKKWIEDWNLCNKGFTGFIGKDIIIKIEDA